MDRLQQPASAGEYDIGERERQTEHVESCYNIRIHGVEFRFSVSIQDHGSAVDVQRATAATTARRSRRQHFLSPIVSDPSG